MRTEDNRGLRVSGVTKQYPGTIAVQDVDLDIYPGEVVALLGENGAGKSTLSSIIAGVTQPTTGTMTWNGEPYSPATPGDAIAAGIGLIHQEMRLLPDLTVAENVMVGRWPMRSGFLDARSMREKAKVQLQRLGFKGGMDATVRNLSVAGQQQVEIAKALMLNASLLILDEPTAALGQSETEALFDCVRSLQAEGVSFIYVSHRLAEIAQIATRIVVLRDGRKITEHASGEVSPKQLVEEMVGRPVERLFPEVPPPTDKVVLQVQDLHDKAGNFTDVSFSVREGEIFGIAGIVGAGRTELVRAIAGAQHRHGGTVQLDGRTLKADDPMAAIKAGIVLIPEDRKQQGLVVSDTIENNIALPNMTKIGSGGWIAPAKVRKLARSVAAGIGMKGNVSLPVASLSGGNQQKVVIGKWLERNPRLVILDEPTRGIDVGARASIYEVIAELARNGNAVVVVSSDLEEVLGLAHRVMVLARGQNQGILDADEASPTRVMELATS
ncbi:sugar ABC transporter ATP-binding protein [Arthrobacter crusticola]|uniref:Sugar ABC transporter ATP-binding protein n=1 Tax=Arthrobacter crusticola TaxID=2547960 RepID=A0A4R5U3P2_9MICC|nr:sugar ABC transporter ATP-binding protein [Arthrobacter crusticola]TDK28238.1 sugar ABC transporter ATP-binding protein [Arthrobacter crusticola]